MGSKIKFLIIFLGLSFSVLGSDSTCVKLNYRPVSYTPWVIDVRVLGTVTLNTTQDYFAVYDSSALGWRKIKVSSFLTSALDGGYWKLGGNSFGTTARLGTNDANALQLETMDTVRMEVGTDGEVAITHRQSGGFGLSVNSSNTASSMRFGNSTSGTGTSNGGYVGMNGNELHLFNFEASNFKIFNNSLSPIFTANSSQEVGIAGAPVSGKELTVAGDFQSGSITSSTAGSTFIDADTQLDIYSGGNGFTNTPTDFNVLTSDTLELYAQPGGNAPILAFHEDPDETGAFVVNLQAPNLTASVKQTFTQATGEIPVVLKGSATLNFPSTAAGTCSDLTITVTGAVDGDVTMVGVPNGSTPTTGQFTAWVSAADTVTVMFCNNALVTAADPALGTFKVQVSK